MLRLACSRRLGGASLDVACIRGVANATQSGASPPEQDATGASPGAALSGLQEDFVGSVLRVDLVAQGCAAHYFSGRARVQGAPPDTQAFVEQEHHHLRTLQALAQQPQHRVRPSLLAPLASAAFAALGALSAIGPQRLSAAVAAGLQDALTDTYNQQLRELRECGVSAALPELRLAVRDARDLERAPHGAVQPPDITALQRLGDLSPEEGVALVVKAGTRALLNAAKRL